MQCVEIGINNAIQAVVDNGNCALYLVSASDVILNSVFSLQWVAENGGQEMLNRFFYAGFTIPILCNLTAWTFNLVLNQIHSDKGN